MIFTESIIYALLTRIVLSRSQDVSMVDNRDTFSTPIAEYDIYTCINLHIYTLICMYVEHKAINK